MTDWKARCLSAESDREKLVEALRPFADLGPMDRAHCTAPGVELTLGDFRKATSALEGVGRGGMASVAGSSSSQEGSDTQDIRQPGKED